MEPATRHEVPGFRHVPGNHCGSTALRNLLGHGAIELSEEMAFGLGAGARFFYVVFDDASPSRWFNGRGARLEEKFLELTGAPLRLETFDDPDAAWEAARASVDSGTPALLLTDLYYLDHYGKLGPFPRPCGRAGRLRRRDGLPLRHRIRGAAESPAREPARRPATPTTRRSRWRGTCSPCPTAPRRGDLAAARPGGDRAGRAGDDRAQLGEFAGLPALRRLPPRPATGPRRRRTGSGARASPTR